jgi:hypothetical protein
MVSARPRDVGKTPGDRPSLGIAPVLERVEGGEDGANGRSEWSSGRVSDSWDRSVFQEPCVFAIRRGAASLTAGSRRRGYRLGFCLP